MNKTKSNSRSRHNVRNNPTYLHYCRITSVDVTRKLCQQSFEDFSKEFWSIVVPEKLNWGWHMAVICSELQEVCERIFRWERKQYDLFINVPPGSSKSTLSSILLLGWVWTRMPSFRIIGGSFDERLSIEFGMKARRVVTCERYNELFPEVVITPDQNAKSHFANTQGGVRYVTSTGASIIGRHAHLITVDDPLNPRGIRSEAEIVNANQWMRETLPTRCVDPDITVLACIMQRLGLEDPTGERLKRSRIWTPEMVAV